MVTVSLHLVTADPFLEVFNSLIFHLVKITFAKQKSLDIKES